MKKENEINDDLKRLLDTLEEHGRNTRRQAQLSDLIDHLDASGTSLRGGTTKQFRYEATSQGGASTSDKTSSLDCFVHRNDGKRHKLYPLWWSMGAVAACLLLWLLVIPTTKQTPEMKEKLFVEETMDFDSLKTKTDEVIFEEPVMVEELLAEETPLIPQKTQIKKEKSRKDIIEEVIERPVVAAVTPTEPEDTSNMESNTIPIVSETPADVQKPQRRVIRSLNLVCYECKKDPERDPQIKPDMENRTLFGQPQDPNMKNGALAFEFKLN